MSLELKLNFAGGDTTIKIYQNANEQLFEIYFPPVVTEISVDPNNWAIDSSTIISTGINYDNFVIESFYLYQNYPNPFNPITTIGFGVQNKSNVKITILNAIGEEVAVVLNEEKEPGYHQVEFNATNLPSGVYFYQLKAGSFIETKKMLLLK